MPGVSLSSRVSPTVLGRGGRIPATVAVLIAGTGLVALAVHYRGVVGPGPFEAVLAVALRESLGGWTGALRALVVLGRPSTVILAALLMAVVALIAGQPRMAIVAAIAPPLTGGFVLILQPLISRTLDGHVALPSGHTAGATSVALVAALLAVSLAGRYRRSVAAIAGVLSLTVAGTVAVALVANGLHYVSDTVAGFLVAVTVVFAMALVADVRGVHDRAVTGRYHQS